MLGEEKVGTLWQPAEELVSEKELSCSTLQEGLDGTTMDLEQSCLGMHTLALC